MQEPICGARSFLRVLLNIESLIGLLVFLVTIIYYLSLSNYLGENEQKVLFGQLFHFHLLALLIILMAVANNYLWNRLWDLPIINNDLIIILHLWVFINTFLLLCGLGTLWSLTLCVEETIRMAETSLFVGIDEYFESPKWKLRWDEVQFHQQCCGINSYSDWMSAKWLPTKTDPQDSKVYAPYSCCRQNSSECYKKYVPHPEVNIPRLEIISLNMNGCLPIFKSTLWKLIYLLWFLIILAILVQLFVWGFIYFVLKHQCTIDNISPNKIAGLLSSLAGFGNSNSCACKCSKDKCVNTKNV